MKIRHMVFLSFLITVLACSKPSRLIKKPSSPSKNLNPEINTDKPTAPVLAPAAIDAPALPADAADPAALPADAADPAALPDAAAPGSVALPDAVADVKAAIDSVPLSVIADVKAAADPVVAAVVPAVNCQNLTEAVKNATEAVTKAKAEDEAAEKVLAEAEQAYNSSTNNSGGGQKQKDMSRQNISSNEGKAYAAAFSDKASKKKVLEAAEKTLATAQKAANCNSVQNNI